MALFLMTALFLSIVDDAFPKISPTQNANAQTSTRSCQKLPTAGLTANNNGFLAPKVLDNNFNTAWSNDAKGSWIQVDLGAQKIICTVDIAWYLGNKLNYNFVISVSNDGTTFTNVFTGKSSGSTIYFETYFLPGSTTGRYVRVTTNGNNVNSLASITELSVDGFSNASSPAPIANNENTQTKESTTVQITLTGTDPIAGDMLKFSVVALPQHGTLTSGTTANSVNYTPNSGFTGTDGFTYKATGRQGVDSNIATVTITVNAPPPPAPTAYNLNIHTKSGTPVQITLRGTDPIQGDVLKFSVVNLPQHGTVTSGTTFNSVIYTPYSGFSGTDRFTYKATDGRGVDSNIATATVSPLSSSTLDQFGITELYPTKANGEQWFINMQNPTSDPQLNPNGVTLTKNADGSYKVTSSSVRLQIYTSSGYHQNLITTYDQQILAQKGYMQSPNDWKNVEITGYMKVNHFTTSTTNGAAHIELLARGGTHTSSVPCEGTAYHSNTYETGRVKFEKELEHTAGYTTNDPQISGATGNLQGKWVGFKAVFYTFPNGTVELEQWLDDKSDNIISPGNNWHRVLQFKDVGSWGGGTNSCGGTPTTIITWGGPITHFRWDNIDDMDLKDFSVREIQPPRSNVWSGFVNLGGYSISNPVVAQNSDGRLEAFVIGSDHALYHKSQTVAGSSSNWTDYSYLGGYIISNPVVARNSDGRLEVFVIGSNHALFHIFQTGASSNSWSGYNNLGGYILGDPAVKANTDGRLELFVIGNDHGLYYNFQQGAGSNIWSGFVNLGGYSISNPVVAQNSDGRLEVFIITADHTLYHIFELATSSVSIWSAFINLGGYIISDPAAAQNSDGRLQVFVIGSDHALYSASQVAASSTSWSGYTYLGGIIASNTSPAAALNSDGQLQVFVIGANSAIYYKFQTTPGSTSWTGYFGLGGLVFSNPVVATNSDGRLELFVIGSNNALFHNFLQ
jgi:hypothetical protein